MTERRSGVEALPVLVSARGPHAAEIRRWLEGVAGWQPVDAETARLVPPLLMVADVQAGDLGGAEIPRILLVNDDDRPCAAAVAARGAHAVVRWPDERDRLAVVAEDLSHPPTGGTAAYQLRVGGASGGVGTTTVALAVAGLIAWSGDSVLVVGHGPTPVPDVPRRRPEDLLSAGTWDAAAPVPGVRALRVVLTEQPALDAAIDAGPADWVVRDVGCAEEADVMVLRPDRSGLRALHDATSPVAVVIGDGPASERALAAVASRRRYIHLPWSARVARAGLAQRVPAGIPGSWLRRLRPALHGRSG